MRIHLKSESQFPSKGSTQSELADYGTRRLVKPFNSHETVTPSKYAKTTHMHRCQRSGLASTAIQTCYSALRKENSIRLSAFQSTGLDGNIYLCVSLASNETEFQHIKRGTTAFIFRVFLQTLIKYLSNSDL